MSTFTRRKFLLLSLLVTACIPLAKAQVVDKQVPVKKRIYLANDDHTDYMWTANEARYDSAFVEMLDYYLDRIDATRNNPDDYQSRFNCDGSYWLQAYQKHRSPEQFERLLAAIRSGHISVPLHMLINCYGGQPTEAVLRGMYYAGQVERKYDLRFRMAGTMENNTLPFGLSSLWAGSGARYSWNGIGGYGSQMSLEYRAKRRNQLYHYRGADSLGVVMKWYVYDEGKTAPLGGYAELRTTMKSKDPVAEVGSMINRLDAMCDTVSVTSKYPYNVVGAFGYGHDDLKTLLVDPFITVAKQYTTPERRVRVSIYEDFFEDIAQNYTHLPSEMVTYGNEWDLYPASMNETTANMRRATEKLRTAEALAAIVSLRENNFADDLTAMRDKAWNSFGLYWEHDWTGDSRVGSYERPDWQIGLQKNLTSYVDTLLERSVKALGEQIAKTSAPRFFVFNALNWDRSDVVEIAWEENTLVKVIDLQTQKEVPSQLVTKGGKQYIRTFVPDIPSVGYKVFEIREGKPVKVKKTVNFDGKHMTSPYYKLQLAPSGAITSVIDKRAGNRQLVRPMDGKYLNDLGSPDINLGEPVSIENEGPVSMTLKAVSDHPIRHTVRVTLFADAPRIEIEDSIQANFGDVKTWAFSFALDGQTTRYEELGAILTARKETRGGHYAAENARYDWQTFNHFANMSEEKYGVTLSNLDCSFFKLGESKIDSLWENSSQLNALAGGQVDKKIEDGGAMGYRNQHGTTDFLYRFGITTHPQSFDAVESMKFSLEHQNPLIAGMVSGNHTASSKVSYSFLTVSDPNVLLWSLKPSEEGIENGLITRFWNMGAAPSSPVITVNGQIGEAWQTTHVETNEKELFPSGNSLKADFRQHQIKTFRLQLKVLFSELHW